MPCVNPVREAKPEPVRRKQGRPDTCPLGQHYSDPTELEIEEGEAHKRWCKHPLRSELKDAWMKLHLQIFEEYGSRGTATTRCGFCHVIRFNRPYNIPCGHCGKHRKEGDQIIIDVVRGEAI